MIGSITPLAKHLQRKNVNIFDIVFLLHSKCTFVILLTFMILLSAKQYFGDPIQCMTDLKFKDFVHSYCWTIGTFLIPKAMDKTRNTISVGVGPNTIEHTSMRYYQWVVIVLLLEAMIFYFPAFLWKIWEGKRLNQLCSTMVDVIITHDKLRDHCSNLSFYFNANNSHIHKNYVIKYFTCEFLNLGISITNIIFLDYFLNGYWSRYFNTLSTISLNDWSVWNHNSSQIFPKLAKCTIYTFGMGGSINNNDALCMLPLNILNEKIFAFLWVWFILMALLATLKILYDLCLLIFSPLRIQLLRLRVRSISTFQMRSILHSRSFADWFVLYKVSLNVNPIFFYDLLIELHEKNPAKKKYSMI